MVDFNALMKRTPEERVAASAEAEARYEERIDSMVTQRAQMLMDLEVSEASDRLSSADLMFLDSLRSKAKERDHVTGRVGRELAWLSDPQVAYLSGLHRRAGSVPELTSRAARFRQVGG